ncbi:MAG: polymer-forming cytoskeletal protein [Alphaproteobacteria bacterium]
MRKFFQPKSTSQPQVDNNGTSQDGGAASMSAGGGDWNPPAVVPPIQRPGMGVPSPAPTVAGQIASVNRYANEVVASSTGPAQSPKPTGNTLTVGPDIHFKGEVKDCDTLVVEGNIEAATKSRVLRIAETGVFIGEAEIDTAEISGRFEGKLKATSRLLIRATGQVSGNIQYGEICIEAGGRISGDVQTADKGEK